MFDAAQADVTLREKIGQHANQYGCRAMIPILIPTPHSVWSSSGVQGSWERTATSVGYAGDRICVARSPSFALSLKCLDIALG